MLIHDVGLVKEKCFSNVVWWPFTLGCIHEEEELDNPTQCKLSVIITKVDVT